MMFNVILNEGHIEDSHYVHCRKAALSLSFYIVFTVFYSFFRMERGIDVTLYEKSRCLINVLFVVTLHEQELCDQGWCPFIYIYIYKYVYDPIKTLNGTLAVKLPFQTLVVDFSLDL